MVSMTKNYQRGLPAQAGFGFGTLVVIVALVLIVGSYIYYTGQNAAPTSSETTYPPTGLNVPVTPPDNQLMETGDVIPAASTSTSAGVASTTVR